MSMKIFSKQEPSEMIKKLVCNGGSPVVTCQQCGRTLFDSTGEFMDPGELEKLLEKERNEPEKYIGSPWCVDTGDLTDNIVLIDCPCNYLSSFEENIWSHRGLISEYLIQRANSELKDAQKTAEDASGTSIVNQT